MRAEEFCSRRSQKVSVPTVNSISNDKHAGTGQEKGRKTAHRQSSQAVEVCHGEVLEAKLRGIETDGEKSQPQVGGVHPKVRLEWRGGERTQHRDDIHRQDVQNDFTPLNKLCRQMCRIKILCMIIALQLYLYIELQQKNGWEHNVFYLIFTVKKNKIFYQEM